ncbi:MAG TPA: hypothetical protein DCG90_16345 [Sphingobium sp.]|jgi:hypothetical protein|nr:MULTISPECIES: hypothetical protein [unclassified Sphingobium]OAN58726.1 hypothetical protein A7Q26_13940 [Sphingobium sp. TCM1]HAF43302.1 hypothetical protein [Sphingobium sp.]
MISPPSSDVRFGALIERGIRDLTYTYVMGDDRRRTVTVENVGPGNPDIHYPRFVTGEHPRPPEDIDGFPGFEMFLDAMVDPSHEEHMPFRLASPMLSGAFPCQFAPRAKHAPRRPGDGA